MNFKHLSFLVCSIIFLICLLSFPFAISNQDALIKTNSELTKISEKFAFEGAKKAKTLFFASPTLDKNSIIGFRGWAMDGNIYISIQCDLNTKAAITVFDEKKSFQEFPISLPSVDCNTYPLTYQIYLSGEIPDSTSLFATADITPFSSPCLICAKQNFFLYKAVPKEQSVPDSSIVLVVLTLAIVVGLLFKRKN